MSGAPSCTPCPSGWFLPPFLLECGDTAANHLSCTTCPQGWTSGNESASCVIDKKTRQPLIRFTGLRVVSLDNKPGITIEWEYTPGEALQSEPLQLQVSYDDGKKYQNMDVNRMPPCNEDCRMSVSLNLTLTRRPILLRLKGAESGAESTPFQRWQTASDCAEGQYLWTEDSDVIKWKCKTCGDGTLCAPGSLKSDVRARFGWWRSTSDTVGMTRCIFPAACLGNSTRDPALRYRYPIGNEEHEEACNVEWGHKQICNGGHRCRLCATCRQGFKRAGHGRCQQCPADDEQSPFLVGGFILTAGALAVLIWMAMNSAGSEASLADAVRKLFINYLQVSALAAGFPSTGQVPMEVLFELQGSVSTAGEHLLSPDCELSVLPAADAFYTKQVASSICTLFHRLHIVCNVEAYRMRAQGALAWREDEARGHRNDATATTPKDRAVLTRSFFFCT